MDKRLEGCEAELRTKEDELFLQLERNLRLEEEVERTKLERDNYLAARERLDQEQQSALRRLHLQLDQNEITRRNLERARLDVVRQANIIREEKDALEKEVSPRKSVAKVERSPRDSQAILVSILSLAEQIAQGETQDRAERARSRATSSR